MGKKNKNNENVQRSTNSTACESIVSLEDEIIQHFQLLKEAGDLVIGLNAVLRGLKKKSFCVIVLISKKATSAMYHALNMMCKNTDVIFLQLQDINCIPSHSKIPSSTAYGIKTSILSEQQKFGNLIEEINRARNSPKFKKQRNLKNLSTTSDNISLSNENLSCIVDSECYKNDNNEPAMDNTNLSVENQYQRTEPNSFIHSNHVQPVINFSRSEYGFLTIKEIDFPNYNCKSDKISFIIK